MSKLRQYQITLAFLIALLGLSLGYSIYLRTELHKSGSEVTAISASLEAKSQELTKINESIKSDILKNEVINTDYEKSKSEIAHLQAKLNAFAIQASACEKLRKNIK